MTYVFCLCKRRWAIVIVSLCNTDCNAMSYSQWCRPKVNKVDYTAGHSADNTHKYIQDFILSSSYILCPQISRDNVINLTVNLKLNFQNYMDVPNLDLVI